MPWKARTVRRTYSWTSSAASLPQRSMNDTTRRSGPPRRGQRQLRIAQTLDLIAQRRRLFEVEVGRSRLHLLLKRLQVRVELLLIVEALGAVDRRGRGDVVALVDTRHHFVDGLDDRLRRDAVLVVVGLLNRAPALGLADRRL